MQPVGFLRSPGVTAVSSSSPRPSPAGRGGIGFSLWPIRRFSLVPRLNPCLPLLGESNVAPGFRSSLRSGGLGMSSLEDRLPLSGKVPIPLTLIPLTYS